MTNTRAVSNADMLEYVKELIANKWLTLEQAKVLREVVNKAEHDESVTTALQLLRHYIREINNNFDKKITRIANRQNNVITNTDILAELIKREIVVDGLEFKYDGSTPLKYSLSDLLTLIWKAKTLPSHLLFSLSDLMKLKDVSEVNDGFRVVIALMIFNNFPSPRIIIDCPTEQLHKVFDALEEFIKKRKAGESLELRLTIPDDALEKLLQNILISLQMRPGLTVTVPELSINKYYNPLANGETNLRNDALRVSLHTRMLGCFYFMNGVLNDKENSISCLHPALTEILTYALADLVPNNVDGHVHSLFYQHAIFSKKSHCWYEIEILAKPINYHEKKEVTIKRFETDGKVRIIRAEDTDKDFSIWIQSEGLLDQDRFAGMGWHQIWKDDKEFNYQTLRQLTDTKVNKNSLFKEGVKRISYTVTDPSLIKELDQLFKTETAKIERRDNEFAELFRQKGLL